jgi:hypothetical protein
MIIYSQSQSHYESAKSKLKAGDLCFIGDEKKIIFHKSAEGGDPVVYEGTDDFIKKSTQYITLTATDKSASS